MSAVWLSPINGAPWHLILDAPVGDRVDSWPMNKWEDPVTALCGFTGSLRAPDGYMSAWTHGRDAPPGRSCLDCLTAFAYLLGGHA